LAKKRDLQLSSQIIDGFYVHEQICYAGIPSGQLGDQASTVG